MFAFIDQCTRFDLVPLPNGQAGITFYSPCKAPHDTPKMFGSSYLCAWDGDIRDDRYYYYRLGYCPVVFENGFAKAVTLLLPGYRNTPEYSALIKTFCLLKPEKEKMIRHATSRQMKEKTDIKLVKWFHRNSVPQVIETKTELYAGLTYT